MKKGTGGVHGSRDVKTKTAAREAGGRTKRGIWNPRALTVQVTRKVEMDGNGSHQAASPVGSGTLDAVPVFSVSARWPADSLGAGIGSVGDKTIARGPSVKVLGVVL